jgi:hypothetical protein
MIVEEVEVPAGEPIDLGQRVVHGLGIKPFRPEEGFLVAEVAGVRASRDTTMEFGAR